jgi:hypothetical protein
MNKILVSLLVTTTLFSTITPAWGQEKVANTITFSCEKRQGVSTTVAKNSNGEIQPIFHWKRDTFLYKVDLQRFCQTASSKLNESFRN